MGNKYYISILIIVLGWIVGIVVSVFLLVSGIKGAMIGLSIQDYSMFTWSLVRAIFFELGMLSLIPFYAMFYFLNKDGI
jgi:hypothetical protein